MHSYELTNHIASFILPVGGDAMIIHQFVIFQQQRNVHCCKAKVCEICIALSREKYKITRCVENRIEIYI